VIAYEHIAIKEFLIIPKLRSEECEMLLSDTKILVAEDEPDQINFIRTVLEDNGADVVIAHNGTEALEMARAKQPHAMTLDINMPGMDVMDLLGELKNDPNLSELKICIVSGRPELRTILRDRHLNANAYLDKPFSEDDLVKSLLGLLGR
jgi:two-component system alkaline phosphatase synthesis response regulator PhoP